MSNSEPFYFIGPELRNVVLCIERNQYEQTRRDITFEQYLSRESESVLDIGYFQTVIRDWQKCSTLDDLERYQAMGLVQVVQPETRFGPTRIIIPTKLPRLVALSAKFVGESIRNWLIKNRQGSPSDFWKEYREVRRKSTYMSIAKYFYALEKIGVIEKVAEKPYVLFNEVYHGRNAKVLYGIVRGKESDPSFRGAQQQIYPATRLGKRRYRERVEGKRRSKS